jgi:hypothetical protein
MMISRGLFAMLINNMTQLSYGETIRTKSLHLEFVEGY